MAGRNEGIINRGRFRAGQVVVGRGARLTMGSPDPGASAEKEQLAVAIDGFLKALEAHATKLDELEELVQVVGQLAEEAEKEQPNKLTLKGLLSSIKSTVVSVAEMAPALTTLTNSVLVLMGQPRP